MDAAEPGHDALRPHAAEHSAPPGPAPSPADGVERGASPRHVTVERLAGAVVGAALVTGAALGALVLELAIDGPLAWLGRALVVGALGLAALLQWWPGVQHRHLRWRLDAAALRIRRGVLWRTEIDVPRVRVQHTDVVQGPLERRFGLARLVVHTAGTVDATVELPGLELTTARAVRGHLVGGGDDGAV